MTHKGDLVSLLHQHQQRGADFLEQPVSGPSHAPAGIGGATLDVYPVIVLLFSYVRVLVLMLVRALVLVFVRSSYPSQRRKESGVRLLFLFLLLLL